MIKGNFSEMAPKLGHPVARGLVFALATATVLMLIAATYMANSSALDDRVAYVTYTIHVIAAIIGSFTTARRAVGRGWYYGGLTGLSYMLIVMAINLVLFKGGNVEASDLLRAMIIVVVGAFGGMLGASSRQQ